MGSASMGRRSLMRNQRLCIRLSGVRRDGSGFQEALLPPHVANLLRLAARLLAWALRRAVNWVA